MSNEKNFEGINDVKLGLLINHFKAIPILLAYVCRMAGYGDKEARKVLKEWDEAREGDIQDE